MIERTITFGADSGLIGTLCLPSTPGADGSGVGQILFNAGVVHRIGPHRINVKLARSLAASGIASIRFDLSGLGDSARASGNLAFEEQAVIDIRSYDCASPLFASCASIRDMSARASPEVAALGYLLAWVSSRLTAWRRSAVLPVRWSANAS